MNAKFRRIAAATAVAGAVLGLSSLTAGAALANPSDQLCTADDLNVTVTKDLAQPGETEAFLVKYTGTSPDTNCKLQGTPGKVALLDGETPLEGAVVRSDDTPAEPVNVQGKTLFGISRIVQQADAPANPVVPSGVRLVLPGIEPGPDSYETAAWPAGEVIKGSTLTATPITLSGAE